MEMSTRTELRQSLEGITRLNAPAQRLTSLGMHYIPVDEQPVLVLVEINVPRLLAVLGKRLRKSKRGVAGTAHGAVRLSVATAEGREICGAAEGKR